MQTKKDRLLKKYALSPVQEKMDDAIKAINYVSSILGNVPTPVGNPFSIIAFADQMEKGKYFEGLLFLLTAIPDLGAVAGAIKNFPRIMQGIKWLAETSTVPLGFKKKILSLILTFFQSTSWVNTIKDTISGILMKTATAENITNKLKAYAKKVGVQAVDDAEQLADSISTKMVADLTNYMKTCENQVSAVYANLG